MISCWEMNEFEFELNLNINHCIWQTLPTKEVHLEESGDEVTGNGPIIRQSLCIAWIFLFYFCIL